VTLTPGKLFKRTEAVDEPTRPVPPMTRTCFPERLEAHIDRAESLFGRDAERYTVRNEWLVQEQYLEGELIVFLINKYQMLKARSFREHEYKKF
jgi:hypothetical protein